MMRVRQCRGVLHILLLVGVFAFGMLGGMYYEATKHGAHQVDGALRGAETRNLPVGAEEAPVPSKHLDTGEETDGGSQPAVDGANAPDGRQPNVKEPDGLGKPEVQHQEPVVAHGDHNEDAVLHLQEGGQPDAAMHQSDNNQGEHSADIVRNSFGPPIRLEANVQSMQKSQVSGRDAKPPANPAEQVAIKQPSLKQEQRPADQPQVQAVKQPPQKLQKHPAEQSERQLVDQTQMELNKKKTLVSHQDQPSQHQEPVNTNRQLGEKGGVGKEQPIHAPAPQPAAAMPAVQPGQPPAPEARDGSKNRPVQPVTGDLPKVQGKIIVSVVICGDRTDEALVMVKSAAILTPTPLHFHIFAEEELQSDIASKLKLWPEPYRTKVSFDIHNIAFPPNENAAEWKKMFKKCATQRLFLPDLLQDTDALLYVDTDILFTKPLEFLWSFFQKFNSTQLAALAPEHEVTSIGWYNRFARHPYYGQTGLNSGVMLMNLTRMRNFGWSGKILPIYREYKLKITWGDQDLLNILFHFHPELVYTYECDWNLRPDHCMYSLNCRRIEQEGIGVIHGNRGVYHNEKQLPFRVIYEAFRDYQFGTNLISGLVQPLKLRFNQPDVANMYCTKGLQFPLIKTLQKYCSHSD